MATFGRRRDIALRKWSAPARRAAAAERCGRFCVILPEDEGDEGDEDDDDDLESGVGGKGGGGVAAAVAAILVSTVLARRRVW